MSLMWNTKK